MSPSIPFRPSAFSRSAALLGLALFAASAASAISVPHEIWFTPSGGSATLVGGFSVDSSQIGAGNQNSVIGFPPFLTDFNVTFMGSTWATPSLAGPPSGDTTEVILAFTDTNGVIDDMFVLMLDDFAPGATGSVLEMSQGGAFPGGSFSIMSEPVTGTYTILQVPEPSTLLLLSMATVGLGAFSRTRASAKPAAAEEPDPLG